MRKRKYCQRCPAAKARPGSKPMAGPARAAAAPARAARPARPNGPAPDARCPPSKRQPQAGEPGPRPQVPRPGPRPQARPGLAGNAQIGPSRAAAALQAMPGGGARAGARPQARAGPTTPGGARCPGSRRRPMPRPARPGAQPVPGAAPGRMTNAGSVVFVLLSTERCLVTADAGRRWNWNGGMRNVGVPDANAERRMPERQRRERN